MALPFAHCVKLLLLFKVRLLSYTFTRIVMLMMDVSFLKCSTSVLLSPGFSVILFLTEMRNY